MKKKKIISVFIISVTMCLILVGCGKLSLTSNDWVYEKSDFTYHFDKDGSGTYSMGKGNSMKFTYKDNGDSITIIYDGTTNPVTLDYIIEGKKLIITESYKTSKVYVKK